MNDKTHAALAALNFAKENGIKRQKTQVTAAYLNLNNRQDSQRPQTTTQETSTKKPEAPTKVLRPQTVAENPAIVKVDISIAGTSHRIQCPSDLTDTLKNHSEQINQELRQLRGQFKGKSPTNEELLVLHCLDLYDDIDRLKNDKEHQQQDSEQASALADKLIQKMSELLG